LEQEEELMVEENINFNTRVASIFVKNFVCDKLDEYFP
jgi:hypothetical protein